MRSKVRDEVQDRLKKGWVFEFNNQRLIDIGDDVEFRGIKISYSKDLEIYRIIYEGDIPQAIDNFIYQTDDFKNIDDGVWDMQLLFDLEERSMDRIGH